jgi:hypothetical protein
MPDYQLGKIYQLVCLTTGEKYIGSTSQATLALRLSGHVKCYKYWKKTQTKYGSSFPIIERGNYQIELLEVYPCNSKDELNSRECHYIRTILCINKLITGKSKEEIRNDDLEYSKNHREENKVAVIKYDETHREYRRFKKRQYDLYKRTIKELYNIDY